MGSRFTPDTLIAQAVERAGSEDFGEPEWREGLDRYLDSVSTEARLNDLGVEIVLSDVVSTLTNRLNINAFRAAHPRGGRQANYPTDCHRRPAADRDDDPL